MNGEREKDVSILLKNEAGTILYEVLPDENGLFSFTLSTHLKDNEVLQLMTKDKVGNEGRAISVVGPYTGADVTPPELYGRLIFDGSSIYGYTEPDVIVLVRDENNNYITESRS